MSLFDVVPIYSDSEGEEEEGVIVNPHLKPKVVYTRVDPPHPAPRPHLLPNDVVTYLNKNPDKTDLMIYVTRYNIENAVIKSVDIFMVVALIIYPERLFVSVGTNKPAILTILYQMGYYRCENVPVLPITLNTATLLMEDDFIVDAVNGRGNIKIYSDTLHERMVKELYSLTAELMLVRKKMEEACETILYELSGEEGEELNPELVTLAFENAEDMRSLIQTHVDLLDRDPNLLISSVRSIASHIGMVIPVKADPIKYTQNNIGKYLGVDYRHILGGLGPEAPDQIDLTLLRDEEIFKTLGVYYIYNSRAQLVMSAVDEDFSVFRILSYKDAFERAKKNDNTIVGALNIEEASKSPNNICIGSYSSFQFFEIEDLISYFTSSESFNSPVDGVSLEPYLGNVVNLLDSYGDIENLLALRKAIDYVNARTKVIYKEDQTMRVEFLKMKADDRNLISEFMMDTIYTGMYMRRWKGPGYPYPFHADATFGADPNDIVVKKLEVLLDRIKASSEEVRSFMERFHLSNVKNGEYCRREGLLLKYLTTTYRGEICIRMASSTLISTGHRFFTRIKQEDVEGITLQQLDLIQ